MCMPDWAHQRRARARQVQHESAGTAIWDKSLSQVSVVLHSERVRGTGRASAPRAPFLRAQKALGCARAS